MSDDPIERRRTARAARNRNLILAVAGAGGAVLLLACAAGAWVAFSSRGGPPAPRLPLVGPSPGREGEDWTHDELFRHLKSRGVVDRVTDRNPILFGGPAATFARGRAEVTAQKRETAREARDQAGVSGGEWFAWGRFLFTGDGELVAAVRRELGG